MVAKIPVCGIKVGNATDLKGATGCTVVLCESGRCAELMCAAAHLARERPIS